ncbi:MAG: sugar nucleotide-binding protein [Candidatus Aenigmatarchaeota archaeon]
MNQKSTDYVFSGNESNYRENDNRNPINDYGKTKMNVEDIIMNSHIDYTIIRTSGIFGLNQTTGKTNFFLWVYNSLKDNKEIYLVSDQYYSSTYNSTLANAVKEIVDRDLPGIIHFSSKDRINRYDFGILVADIFNLEKTLIRKTIMEDMK